MRNILVFFILCSFVGCKEKGRKLPYYNSAEYTPQWEMQNSSTFHKIRNFELIDQQGKAFTEKNLEGKIFIADFFFTTCPGICPKMAVSMSALQKEFLTDDDVLLVSHSVTPDTDSVAVLKAYAKKRNVNYNKWRLLTGTKFEVYDLGRKYYFVEEDLGINKDLDMFLHTENFVLVDKNLHIRGIYNSLDNNSMEALVNDVKALKEE